MEISNTFLPQEAILNVLKYLEPETLAKVRLVCRTFRTLSDDHSLYHPEVLQCKIINSKAAYQLYKRQPVFNKIMTLFGDRKAYEALPNLHVPHRRTPITTYFDILESSEMDAPIMTGFDYRDRHFFIIRYRENGDLKCQLFLGSSDGTKNWVAIGSAFVNPDLIKEGKYDELAAAIKAGRNGDKVIE